MKQSVTAAAVAAYAGAWLTFAFSLWWKIRTGGDVSICPAGMQNSYLCTIAEVAIALFFLFVWAFTVFPFAFVLTFLPALALAQLAPVLERSLNGKALVYSQFALAVGTGALVMLTLAHALGETAVAAFVVVGMLAAAAGAWAFQKARYESE